MIDSLVKLLDEDREERLQHEADLEIKLDKERRDRNKAMSDLQIKIEDEQDKLEAKILHEMQVVKDEAEVRFLD